MEEEKSGRIFDDIDPETGEDTSLKYSYEQELETYLDEQERFLCKNDRNNGFDS